MAERARVGLRVPRELNAWLTSEADDQGISKNALILKILWEWAERNAESN